MKVRYDKAVLEFIAVSLVILAVASAATRTSDIYINTTGTMNASYIWEGNVKLTDKYVELSDNLWNTTAQIWSVIDNGTFQKGTELFNTTSQVWSVIDNNTFAKLSMNLWNTTAQIWSVVDNGTFTKPSSDMYNTSAQMVAATNNSAQWNATRLSGKELCFYSSCLTGWVWNTTAQVWAVVDNNTFVKLSQNLYNTTSQIWAVIDNNTFNTSAGVATHVSSVNVTARNYALSVNNTAGTYCINVNSTAGAYAISLNNTLATYSRDKFVNKSGDTMKGDLKMDGNSITGVATMDTDFLGVNSNVNDHLIPVDDETLDLGSSGSQWRYLYSQKVYANNELFAGYGSNLAPTFSFTSDTDTGIYHPDGNALGIAIANFERLRITDANITTSINLNMTTANITFSSAGMVQHNGTCVLISGPTSRLEVC